MIAKLFSIKIVIFASMIFSIFLKGTIANQFYNCIPENRKISDRGIIQESLFTTLLFEKSYAKWLQPPLRAIHEGKYIYIQTPYEREQFERSIIDGINSGKSFIVYAFWNDVSYETLKDNIQSEMGKYYIDVGEYTKKSAFIKLTVEFENDTKTLWGVHRSVEYACLKQIQEENEDKKMDVYNLTFDKFPENPDLALRKRFRKEVINVMQEYYDYIYRSSNNETSNTIISRIDKEQLFEEYYKYITCNKKQDYKTPDENNDDICLYRPELWNDVIDRVRSDFFGPDIYPRSKDYEREIFYKTIYPILLGFHDRIKDIPIKSDSALFKIPRIATIYAIPPEEAIDDYFFYVLETNVLYHTSYSRFSNILVSPLEGNLDQQYDLSDTLKDDPHYTMELYHNRRSYRPGPEFPRGWCFYLRDLLIKNGIRIEVPVCNYLILNNTLK